MKRIYFLVVCALLAWGLVALATDGAEKEEDGLLVSAFPAPEFPEAEQPFAGMSEPAGPGSRVPRPEGEPAPPVPPALVWMNSSPLTMAGLRGKVVLIDFWEYTCINCIRTFADNKKWYERYRKYGFTIIGVHCPEFDIAYSVENLRTAVKRFGLPYPVVADHRFLIWDEYHNSTWPNRFLIDAKGIVRYHRPGEGADASFERAIQKLLQEAHPGLKFPPDYTIPAENNPFTTACGIPTPEMYVGDWSGRGTLANPEGYHPGKTIVYKLPADVADGAPVVGGPWETDKNGMTYRGKHKSDEPSEDQLRMRYHARELYAVLNVSHGRPSRLYIQQDGKFLSGENKGVDVQLDSQGRSYIEVREPRMYYLTRNPSFGSHLIALFPTRGGLTVNSYTFGNDCQMNFPHL